ncbi:MAG: helix-turn-helix domain-containing protein [Lachnospiraceae bacterium]|nr:helix-turn-helix domain-containing protein [Lachnospiraceae bacterium]
MSRKSKIDTVDKIRTVENILAGKTGLSEAARQLSVAESSIQAWRDLYISGGPTALINPKKNNTYSTETKLAAVNDYLNGLGSQADIVRKYHLRATCQLHNWIKQYTTHGELKSRGSGGGSHMRKARNTTTEERLKIVLECIANDKNYGAAALKYNCSYQQVRNWVLRYEKMGAAGLEDRRGKRAGTMPSRTPEEELRDKIAELERRNKELQMENDVLKKVRELEMKGRYL